MRITLTRAHIDEGKRLVPDRDAFALAIAEATGLRAWMRRDEVRLYDSALGAAVAVASLPPFIVAAQLVYDAGGQPAVPLVFDLDFFTLDGAPWQPETAGAL